MEVDSVSAPESDAEDQVFPAKERNRQSFFDEIHDGSAVHLDTEACFPGYSDFEFLYSSNQIYYYRARDAIRDLKVFLKCCLDTEDVDAATCIRHEWNCQAHVSEINNIKIPRSLEACNGNKGLTLVFADEGERSSIEFFGRDPIYATFNGGPLAVTSEHSNIDVELFLAYAIDVVRSIDQLHQRGITHGSINPHSLGVGTENQAVIFNLSGSTFLEREDAHSGALGVGFIPFMSPESSGRINRSVDWRSDFYSLGVCFYFFLTGRCPFTSDSALDLVYQHIAHSAIPPHHVCRDLPESLSSIILKMMAKTAEDRYQTGQGLIADFSFLQNFAMSDDLCQLQDFVPGLADAASQFSIPQKLFGRDENIQQLLASFSKVKENGGCGVTIIKGGSGTGKSSLVSEIHRPVLESRSFFASGKFDQYKRGIPFFSLIQAAGDLIRQLVSEADFEIEEWKSEILEVLGGDVAALFDVLPELQQLYGLDYVPPEMAELGPSEREQRFTAVFSRFILIFAKRGSPLVLFLDDIQWSSVVEMNLIANLAMTASTSAHQALSMIIAYRDNEVLEGHHALNMLRNMTDADVAIQVIEVKSIPLDAVREMVSATLRIRPDPENVELETLTKLILAKTDGNAFFITQLLRTLKDQDHILYDFEERCWRFDLAGILREDLPVTVIDLLLSQIQQLSKRTRECLQMAACIGTNRFSLRILATVTNQKPRSMARDLWGALQSGLILPTSAAYKASVYRPNDENEDMDTEPSISEGSSMEEDLQERDATYRFLHDRVQQASYQLLSEEKRAETHFSIGFRLLRYYESLNTAETYIFEIVNQINRGLSVLTQDQLVTVIELNLRAGKRALQATAFDAAMQYLDTAKSLAPDSWWADHFDLSLEINLSHVDATYAAHDYRTAIGNLTKIAEKARNPLERANIKYRMIDVFMGLDDLPSAIEVGLQALEVLGVKVARTEIAATTIMHELRPKIDLDPDVIDTIAMNAVVSDPQSLLIQSLGTSVLLPIYLSRPELLSALCASLVHSTLENGICEAAAYPLIMYGVTLSHNAPTERSRLQGYHLGLGAVKIINRLSAQAMSATTVKVLKVFASHISYWNEPTRAALVYFNSAMSAGLQTFNVEYTCYAYTESCSYAFWAGEPLNTVVQRMSGYLPLVRKYKQRQGIWYCAIQLQAYVNLASECKDPAEIDGEHFSMALEFEALLATDSHPQIFVYYMSKLLVAVYFNRPVELVLNLVQEMSKYAPGSLGTCYISKYMFLVASALVQHLPSLSASNTALFYEFFSSLKFFESGQRLTFGHQVTLIEAEMLTHDGKDLDALEKYESAFSMATSAGNVHEAAHIAERTYLWLDKRNKVLAKKYLLKSFNCFKLAGFRAKVRELRMLYPDLLTTNTMDDFNAISIKPFRNVNMQVNRDGTLSKALATIQPSANSIADGGPLHGHVNKDAFVDQMSEAGVTDATGKTYHSRDQASTVSVRLRSKPVRTVSHPSQFSQSASPFDSELTPTGTMSSYMSKKKITSAPRTSRTSKQFSSDSNSSGAQATANRLRDEVEGGTDFDLDVALKASVLISDVLHVSQVLHRLIETVLMNAGADYGALMLMDKGNIYVEATGRNSSIKIIEHQLLGMNSDYVPSSLVNYVARLKETTVLGSGQNHKTFQAKFGRDPYFQNKKLRSIMCMPVQNSVKLIGVLYLENASTAYTFGPRRVELLNFLCTQAAIAIEKARLYADLEVAKNEAQASNKMKSEFLSTISHEIRTPFNAVLGMSGFLLDTQLSPMQIDYVETIRNSSKELLRVIDDILDFSKMEHGTFELHKDDFSLRECIEGAMQITAERAASKELELAYFNNHGDFPDILVNDTTRFRQVVINLLGNSIKFTEKGSVTLTSNASILKAATQTENAVYRIQVSVQDTGIGIKEEDHQKLFKLFSQIDSSLARNFSGTGLGLAISEKLVRLMNGQIWVESVPGEGSTFHFTIITEIKSVTPQIAHPLSTKLQGLGALILDDSKVAARSLSQSLEWLGMRVLVSESVEELTKTISANPVGSFAVALIDLHYGLADAVLPQLAKYDPSCKILRLSRFGFRQKFDETYQYLIKPVRRERLAKVIAETIYPELKDSKVKVVKEQGKISSIGMASKHPLRILLAEDNMINSRVALQHLKRMGYSAVHAKDGQYCLEEEDKAIYDVILMDVQMPRLDGCQAATRLRAKYAQNPSRCPRIIAMTANAMRGDMERCLEAGMHAYCQKPIIVDVLAQRLLEATRISE